MSKQIKVAGYVRVSTNAQTEGESLSTQRQSIKDICKQQDYKLTEIYADEGISGGTVEERDALLRALHDARNGKFDLLVIRDLTRFGRNARELFNNRKELKDHGVELYFINDNIDTSISTGELMFQFMSIMAEFESKMIKERTLENKIAKAKRGVPPGLPPFGRTFDYDKEEWGVDQEKVDSIEWVYEEYVEKDRSLQQIAIDIEHRFEFSITYGYLVKVLKERCGTHWEVNFEELDKPIPFKIPPLLSEHKIQAIKDRLAHNQTNNRTDVQNKYLLTGFLRCMNPDCHKSLYGQTQHEKYQYYVHPSSKTETCNKFGSVKLEKIEHAVFKTIFENIYDVPTFEKAIQDSLPDEDHIKDLKNIIDRDKEALEKVKKGLANLKDTVKAGAFEMDDLKEDVQELKEAKARLTNEIDEAQHQLDNMPDPEEVKRQAHQIRTRLKRKYHSEEHLQNMSFRDKKKLLHFLFDGKAPNDDDYGIYIDKRGKGKDAEIDYFMFGRLTGLRTIKGDDIDYFPGDDNNNSGGNSGGSGNSGSSPVHDLSDETVEIDGIQRRKKRLKKLDTSHKKSDYKTNNFCVDKNEPKKPPAEESLSAASVGTRDNFNGPSRFSTAS